MNEELIKRIELALRLSDSEIVSDVLSDCRAALSRKYVPMTEAEIWEFFLRHDGDRVASLAAIQTEVIRRAGLEVAND